MTAPQTIAHDAAGFLIGARLGQPAVEQYLKSIRDDTSRILALMTRAGAVAQASAIWQATQQRRVEGTAPASARSFSPAAPARPTATPAPRGAARPAPVDRPRGQDGRFTSGAGLPARSTAAVATSVRGMASRVTGHAQIDPLLGAAGELKGVADRARAVATPLGRIIPGLRGRKDDTPSILTRMWRGFQSRWKREDGTQKSMLATLKDIDGKAGRSGGDAGGGGLLSLLGMIPMLGSLVPGLALVATAAKGLLSRLPVVGPMLAAALAFATDSAIADDPNITPEERQRRRIENGGESVGGLAGAISGAAIGSALLPGIGTVVGAVLGALAGSSVGKMLADALNENMGDIRATWDKAVSGVADTFESAKNLFETLGSWVSSLPGADAARAAAEKAAALLRQASDQAAEAAKRAGGLIGSGVDALKDGAAAGLQSVRGALASAAAKVGVDPGLVAKIAHFESRLDPNAAPISKDARRNTVRQHDGRMALSSAHGLGQFTNAAWGDAIRAYGGRHGVDGASRMSDRDAARLRGDVGLQSAMLAEATRANVALGRQLGGSDDGANTYALHNLGRGGGTKFLKALATNPNATVASVLPAKVIANNPALYGDGSGTFGQAYGRMGKELSRGEAVAAQVRALTPTVTTTVAASPLAAINTPVPPAPVVPKIPPAVAVPQQDSQPARQRETVRVVQAPAPPRQDVPDRTIAHIVTGGISGGPQGR